MNIKVIDRWKRRKTAISSFLKDNLESPLIWLQNSWGNNSENFLTLQRNRKCWFLDRGFSWFINIHESLTVLIRSFCHLSLSTLGSLSVSNNRFNLKYKMQIFVEGESFSCSCKPFAEQAAIDLRFIYLGNLIFSLLLRRSDKKGEVFFSSLNRPFGAFESVLC